MDCAGCIPIIDVGDPADAHPAEKKPVGDRLARWTLARIYGKDVIENGPLFSKSEISAAGIILHFDFVGEGLGTADGSAPRCFALSSDGSDIEETHSKIIAPDRILIRRQGQREPKIVHYAWEDDPQVNLVNSEGLPAMPFREFL
jgi:sialate O-acetylesterase